MLLLPQIEHKFPDTKLKSGDVYIDKFTISFATARMENAQYIRKRMHYMWIEPGKYVRLVYGRETLMSDTRMERLTNVEFVTAARGDVLIGGLGLGLVLSAVLDKPEVTSVTVLELSQDVIHLVSPFYTSEKLKIIQGDINTWQTKQKFDTIYFDIWMYIMPENWLEMKKLHKGYRKNLNKGGWINSWLSKKCRILYKKDQEERYN